MNARSVVCATLLLLNIASFGGADLSAEALGEEDVREFLGRRLVDVRVELDGQAFADPAVLQLIETRVGEPLSMERVRESVDHLVGLGRFSDVQVFAERSATVPDGATLRWELVPVKRIVRLAIVDQTNVDQDAVRAAIADRVGSEPTTSRLADLLDTVSTYFADRGFRRATIATRLSDGETPDRVALELTVAPGARTVIDAVDITGDGERPNASIVRDLRLEPGRVYDRAALEARVAEREAALRAQGYYEARIAMTPTFSADDRTVRIALNVARGPAVSVVFAGDPLPEGQRRSLVPIAEERSVDLDLLEDSTRNIEAYLREQGYRDADARYLREIKDEAMVLTFTVTRGPIHRLASLTVEGNHQIAASDIAPLLVLRAGEPFDDRRVATVASALTELYRVRGFARAAVTPRIDVLPATSDGAESAVPVSVRLTVDEGASTFVGNVSLAGADSETADTLRGLLGLAPGRPFYRPQLDADRTAIERHYLNEGFHNVAIEVRSALSSDGARLDIDWVIDAGPRAVVDRVLVSGNVRTSGDLIRREIVLQPGLPVGDDAVVESQRRLAALGLFRRVRVLELPHGSSDTRDVLIEVEEAPPTTIAYGGGLEVGRRVRTGANDQAVDRIDVAPRAFFEVSRRNLWGKNRSLTLFTRASLRPRDPGTQTSGGTDEGGYGFNDYRLLGTFREPRAFAAGGDFQVSAFLEQAIRTSFNFSRRGVRIEYGRRTGRALTVSGRYTFDRTRLFDIRLQEENAADDQWVIDRVFPQVRLSTLTGSLLRDTRDDVLDPSNGTLLGADGSVAPRALGSEVGFVKTFLQAFAYRRLSAALPLTVVVGVRVGAAKGFERTVDEVVVRDLPASERFFAGGDATVRGFVLDRLATASTLNEQGFPTGGNGLVVVNLEGRTRYWKGVGGVAFFDAGNVFRRTSDINLDDLRPALGGGVRYRSPIGPLRVDIGYNLDRQILPTGARERRAVFHISLGQAF